MFLIQIPYTANRFLVRPADVVALSVTAASRGDSGWYAAVSLGRDANSFVVELPKRSQRSEAEADAMTAVESMSGSVALTRIGDTFNWVVAERVCTLSTGQPAPGGPVVVRVGLDAAANGRILNIEVPSDTSAATFMDIIASVFERALPDVEICPGQDAI